MPEQDSYLAHRLRDGLLQDLVAITMLIENARRTLPQQADAAEVDAILQRAHEAAEGDIRELRALIDQLKAAA